MTAVRPDTAAPDGRRLLRIEARNAATPIERKPEWIKTRAKMGPEYTELQALVKREGLHTVCQEAGCPNIYECWEDREATFLIGGDQCTRRCDFCQIDTGRPEALDRDEPRRVAESVQAMGLRYATITGVARDDLPDGGAWLYAETVRQIHQVNPGTRVELLAPDFNAVPGLLAEVFASRPEVFAHNVETVPRIFKSIRPGFRYDRSLDVLRMARADGLVTKSNLILGMGEERDEISAALRDLHECRLRADHDHPVPAAVPPAPPGHPLGQAGGVRRVARGGRADRLRRRDERPAGALVLPRRAAVRAGDRRARLTALSAQCSMPGRPVLDGRRPDTLIDDAVLGRGRRVLPVVAGIDGDMERAAAAEVEDQVAGPGLGPRNDAHGVPLLFGRAGQAGHLGHPVDVLGVARAVEALRR